MSVEASRSTFAGCLVLAAALALTLGAIAAPSEAAFPKGKNGLIIYACGSEGTQFDLCSINPDGTGRRNLTNTPGAALELFPAFSPDGRRILFKSSSGGLETAMLELIEADGSGRVPLVPAADLYHPSFSPDGRTIVLSHTNPHDIFAMGADGSAPTNLTNNPVPDTSSDHPVFSPDGRAIAFDRDVTGECVPPQMFLCTGSHVFAMRADGSAQAGLTGPTQETYESGPAFSPDGRFVAFNRTDDPGYTDIWVMNADGSGQRALTATPGIFELDPEFSPDGRRIIYSRSNGATADLWTMNADGSDQTILTDTPDIDASEEYPTWQPIHKCGGRRVTIVGDDGPDKLKGTKRPDVIVGFGGKDLLRGRGGNDRICGGTGRDKLVAGGGAKDLCRGGKGKDKAGGCERGKA